MEEDKVIMSKGEYTELLSCRSNWLNLCSYIFDECELSSDKTELKLSYGFGDKMMSFLRLLAHPAYKRVLDEKRNKVGLEER